LARFVNIGFVWNTIHMSIPEGMIDERLLDIKKATDFLGVKPLMVE
jgi:hypothetical protein